MALLRGRLAVGRDPFAASCRPMAGLVSRTLTSIRPGRCA